MDFEFNKLLMDARNVAKAANLSSLVKLENDMVAGESKEVLCSDIEMLASLLDVVVEKLDAYFDGVA